MGGRPFRSPVISFCAILSRGEPRGGHHHRHHAKGRGSHGHDTLAGAPRLGNWVKPSSYTSHLSKLIWAAQLLIFKSACFYSDKNKRDIPANLERICRRFMHQRGETAFGHILQWRLYLSTVAQGAISSNQARWSSDGQEMELQGTALKMSQVPQLVVSEYRRARNLLYNKLLFGSKDVPLLEAWMLHDDLDAEDYGGSWLTDGRNAAYLQGSHDALLREIEQRADLRRAFIRDAPGQNGKGKGRKEMCREAMAVYECEAQEFLKSMITLLHISPAPPLRAPELLSTTYANQGGRRRSILLWEKSLMVYVRYHKSQEMTGNEADNIRFIPAVIADLLVTFLAVVQPLRQTFLRQVSPGTLLSPHLWSTLDGQVWRDNRVSKYLAQACVRAQVPEFKVAWWRQAAASITKVKFTPKERANFDMDSIMAPEVMEEEELLVDLAETSNHSFKTFNQAYAGSSTLVMNTPLHRAYRASQSWRTLFGIDDRLAREEALANGGKRARAIDDLDDGASIVEACKRTKLRARPVAKAKDMEAVARTLYNNAALRLRRPGQHGAMVATMGRHAAEQVVVVLATSSGKSLIGMVGAALEGAATTIMILPAVALRVTMLDRLRTMGLRHLVWKAGTWAAAPLVIVSAEAACTKLFLAYAHRLQLRQALDRIIVDECHLTITATYRKSMAKLGAFVRQVETQTVWMTATLPPDREDAFIRHNCLVMPRMVREATNRANIRYSVQRLSGPDGLCKGVARLVRALLARTRTRTRSGNTGGVMDDLDDDDAESHRGGDNRVRGDEDSRIIVYCHTTTLMQEVASELQCPMYTGDTDIMSDEEKDAALALWLEAGVPRVIAATCALGVGFDTPNVRWVIHAGAPRSMMDFSQESGRAGRDNKPAESMTLVPEAWQPYAPKTLDEEMMQLYLAQEHCLRAVMSQYLDKRQDWRWCMEGEDQLCGVCPRLHTEARPASLELRLAPQAPRRRSSLSATSEEGDSEAPSRCHIAEPYGRHEEYEGYMTYTGPEEVLRQAKLHGETVRRFEADLEMMRSCCLLCRIEGGRPFNHAAGTCSRRWPWINAKKKVLQACKKEGRPWLQDFTACFMCYLPQTICRRADPEAQDEEGSDHGGGNGKQECRFRDMLLPLCYGAFWHTGPRALIKKHFPRSFRNSNEYIQWLGGLAMLGKVNCIQAVCVAAMLLRE